MINNFPDGWTDPLTPRERLRHKLRDGTYRARRSYGQPTSTIRILNATALLAQTTCRYCGTDVSHYYELEHMTPLSRGGRHELANLTKACGFCNEMKGTMTAEEYEGWLKGGFSELQQPQVERMDPWQ